jgi:phenylpropionate dioxygenase-like ring-hydroxylating dioxygenase large terminal subunit
VGLGLPYSDPPSGWFQIAWSDDIAIGDVRPMRFFDSDIVVYRGEDGGVRVFDAFCPHLGAHLGHGGTVRGCDLVCPFHGWRFDAEGHNVEIPYEDRPMRAQRLTPWAVREVNSWIVVWYDARGRSPLWDPPVIAEHRDGVNITGPDYRQFNERVRLQPQFIVENLVDAAHQVDVHGGTEPLEIVSFTDADHVFRVHTRLVLGSGKKSTWLTPDGKVVADLHMEAWGLGMALAWHRQDDSIHVQNSTPIDDEHCALFATLYTVPPADQATKDQTLTRFRFEMKHLGRDINIWEHMRYEPKAPFAGMERKPYGAFRKWAERFYPETEEHACVT